MVAAVSAEVRWIEALFRGSCYFEALGAGGRVEAKGDEDRCAQAECCCPVGFVHDWVVPQFTCMEKGGTSPQAAMSTVVIGPIL